MVGVADLNNSPMSCISGNNMDDAMIDVHGKS